MSPSAPGCSSSMPEYFQGLIESADVFLMGTPADIISTIILGIATGTAIPAFFRWLEARGQSKRDAEKEMRLAEQTFREELRRDRALMKLEVDEQRQKMDLLDTRMEQQEEEINSAKKRRVMLESEIVSLGTLLKDADQKITGLHAEAEGHARSIRALEIRERQCQEELILMQKRLNAVREYQWVWRLGDAETPEPPPAMGENDTTSKKE